MTDFRSLDQVATDFRRVDPQFTQITDLNTLQGLLTDDRFGEAALYASGSGPVMYDLGVLNGPEWEGVRQFLESRLVSAGARRELQQLQQDLQAADTSGDGILNNQEIVRYAQAHTDRWPNVAIFRNAAEIFLNRLPGYLSRTNLTEEQVSRLWGVMNHLARENDRLGVAQDRRGTVYGLSLQGLPSEDRNNPPSLIRRAMDGTLTPQELAAVHHVLETQMSEGQYNFQNGAPLSPVEIGILGQILDGAAAAGHTLHGMTLVSGDAETQLFAERNTAAQRCLEGTAGAMRAGGNGLQEAFTNCATDMARLEGQNPDRIGARALLMRAYTGDLSAAETALLRTWMQQEAGSLGMTCDGTLDCMAQGAMQLFRTIANDPWHFIARNGAFIGGAWLYRRLLLRNAFENRLSQACGGTVINPRDAYRQYERHLRDQMRTSPMWRRFLNQLARNPRRDSFLGRAFINFPVTFLHLAAFNAVAAQKDTGNLAVDIATDLPLIALFEGLDTFDAFNRTSIQNFARANPGLCRPQGVTEPAPVTAPAPEQVTAPTPAELSQMSLPQGELAIAPEVAPVKPIRDFTEADFLAYINPSVAEGFANACHDIPAGLEFLFVEDSQRNWPDTYDRIEAFQQNPAQLADLMVNHYARDAAQAEWIRNDMTDLMTAFPRWDMRQLVSSFQWAMQQYIHGLESGYPLTGRELASLARTGENANDPVGVVRTYFGIRQGQTSQGISFELAQRQFHGEDIGPILEAMRNTAELEAVHPGTVPAGLEFATREINHAQASSWEPHQTLEAALPRAGDLLAASYAPTNPALAEQIRSDMSALNSMYARYGTSEQPITLEATNSYVWALGSYISDLAAGRVPDFASLRGQIEWPVSPMQIRFAAEARALREQEHQEYVRRYETDPQFRAHQDAMGRYEAEMNRRLDPLYMGENPPIMFLPLPALGAAGLLKLLGIGGGAAVETAPAWGWGMAGAGAL